MSIHSSIKNISLNIYSVLEIVLGIQYIKMHQEVNSILEKRNAKYSGKQANIWQQKAHTYLQIKKTMWGYACNEYHYRKHVGNGGIPWRRKLLCPHLKEEPKENFVGKIKVIFKTLRRKDLGKLENWRGVQYEGLSTKHREDSSGPGRKHKSSSFIHPSIHLAHIH